MKYRLLVFLVLFICACAGGGGGEKDIALDTGQDEYTAAETVSDQADFAEPLPDVVSDIAEDEFHEIEIIFDIAEEELIEMEVSEIEQEILEIEEEVLKKDAGTCALCGNLICETECGENLTNCPFDCHVCGNGTCEPGEGIDNCPDDCCGECGDSKCANYGKCSETKATCPADCGGFVCGDGNCDKGENPGNCAQDCAKYKCGNQVCEPTENPVSCPDDCGKNCGNCACDEGESFESCPGDCGFCGDGYCSPCPGLNEDANTCNSDCCQMGVEVCNGKDDNCNDIIDEEGSLGCKNFFVDADGDGYGGTKKKCLCSPGEFYSALNSNDCDDTNSSVNPGMKENCATLFDDNCNSDVNDLDATGCVKRFKDEDKDGVGGSESECRCSPQGDFTMVASGDCDDKNKDVNPFKNETCLTAYDDDCDGISNPENAQGCTKYYYDGDIDGYGTGQFKCLCQPEGFYSAYKDSDCDDTKVNVHPDATEKCSTSYDDDCDGDTNDLNALGCNTFYYDRDDDFFGTDLSECRCSAQGIFTATVAGDCNDFNSSVNPSVKENCATSYDDNCNSQTNEENAKNCVLYFRDDDGDGFGHPLNGQCFCAPSGPFKIAASANTDCNDSDINVNPAKIETCATPFDDNCNGSFNELNASGCIVRFADVDGDGYYADNAQSECRCDKAGIYTATKPGDCDDIKAYIHPSVKEVIDGIDNDCNGKIDDLFKIIALDTAGKVGEHTSLAIDSGNYLHISYYDEENQHLKYATNVTGAWIYSTVDSSPKAGTNTSIAVDSAGKLFISYVDWNNQFVKLATNKTGSWQLAVIDSSAPSVYGTSLGIDSTNRRHVAYVSMDSLRYAADTSGSWTVATLVSDDQIWDCSLAVDPAGRVHISYYSYNDGDLKYATDASGSWQFSAIDSLGDTGYMSFIASNSGGKIFVSYFDMNVYNLKYTTNLSGNWTAVIVDTSDMAGSFSSMAIDSENTVHIAYYDETNKDLKYTTNRSGSWTIMKIDSEGDVGWDTSTGIGSDNNLYVSYYDWTNGDLKLAYYELPPPCAGKDSDNDGHADLLCGGDDCDDTNPEIYPGKEEDCNTAFDDDCNGLTNEKDAAGCTVFWKDNDEDGFGNSLDFQCLCAPVGKYTAKPPKIDCNDNDASVNPGKTEACDDKDNNCKNGIDEDCDKDDDDFCDELMITVGNPAVCPKGGWDCNDNDGAVNPGAAEVPDGIDNNCDGSIDDVWEITTYAIDSAGQVGYFTSIALDSGNHVHICYGDKDLDSLKYSTDKSGSWIVETIDSGSFKGFPDITIDAGDKIHISYYNLAGLTYMTNSSGTWITEPVDTSSVGKSFSSIGIDTDNKVHIAYFDGNLPVLKYATNKSGNWNINILDSNGSVGEFASIAVDSSDKIHISYLDVGNYHLKYTTNLPGSWLSETIDNSPNCGSWSSITLDSQSKVHISYMDENILNLKYITNKSGTWISQVVDSNQDTGYFSSIAVDKHDKVHIAYFDNMNNILKYARQGSWKIFIIDSSSSDAGEYASIAVDDDNVVHISYCDFANMDLKYAAVEPSSCVPDCTGKECGDNECGGSCGMCSGNEICMNFQCTDPCGGICTSPYPCCVQTMPAIWACAECGPGCVSECDDDYLCTDDSCDSETFSCIHSPKNCEDNNVCTTDLCDSVSGNCGHFTNTLDCEDGDKCTEGDKCSGAMCVPGSAVNCNDNNVCTNDSCNPSSGCTHTYNSAICDDSDNCTIGDYCQNGTCKSGNLKDSDNDGYIDNACGGNDCNDSDKFINPGAAETCDAKDNNCDSFTDPENSVNCSFYFKDSDSDGFGHKTDKKCLCGAEGNYKVTNNTDCDDSNSEINPSAKEVVDGIDNNCDGKIDDAFKVIALDSAGDTGKFSSIAVDSGDRAHISYYDATNKVLRYAVDVMDTWQFETVDTATNTGYYTSIAVDGSKKAHISYQDYNKRDLKYATNAAGSWELLTLDSNSFQGAYTSIALDPGGKVHISYQNENTVDLKYITNATGVWVIKTLDSDYNIGTYTSIDVDSAGKVHISHYDYNAYDLRYVTDASGSWVMTVIDSVNEVGSYDSLKTDSNNFVHVSYYDITGMRLKYATNKTGSWVIEVVDSTVNYAGEYSSLAIDGNDRVHISYQDATNDDLRYATNSSGSWVLKVVDSEGYVGYWTSIAAGTNKIHISYYDSTNGDLKYAVLNTSPSCSGKDTDNDTYVDEACGGNDCNDNDPDIHPNASETCNGKDDNCNGQTDEGLGTTTCGTGECKKTVDNCQNGQLQSCVPGTPVVETCDGKDNDCNNIVDDPGATGCTAYYKDSDGDGFGNPSDSKCLCAQEGSYTSLNNKDCNDGANSINPNATDTVGNSIDENCDGLDGVDSDKDGYASTASGGTDCNDSNKDINPGIFDYVDGTCAEMGWEKFALASDGDFGGTVSMAIDPADMTHIAYYDKYSKDLIYASNLMVDWTFETVDSAGDVGMESSLAVDMSGRAYVAYLEKINEYTFYLKYGSNFAGSWNLATVDTNGDCRGTVSIAVDTMRRSHISYYYSSGNLIYATNSSGSWVKTQIDNSMGNQCASVAVDGSNRVHIGYFYQNDADGPVNYATNASGSWSISTIDHSGPSGCGISLALDPSGKVHLTHIDSTELNVDKLVYVTNASGSWEIYSVTSEGSAGSSSIKVDDRDSVHISYYDNVNKDLRYAGRSGGSWLSMIIDSEGDVGLSSSIAPDSSYLMHISYNDTTNLDIKKAFFDCMKYGSADDENCDGVDGMDSDKDSFASKASGGSDCDDTKSDVNPSEKETCMTFWDDNCDGSSNDVEATGCLKYYRDHDGDGYGDSGDYLCVCDPGGEYIVLEPYNTDCDDNNNKVSPDAQEIIDGIDNNCDMKVDNVFTIEWVDADGLAGFANAIAVDGSDSVHMSYTNYPEKLLRHATNQSGSWMLSIADSMNMPSPSGTSIAIDSINTVYISYAEAQHGGGLRLAFKAGGLWSSLTVDPTMKSGNDSSIGIDSTGRVHISHYDETDQDLRYARDVSGSWEIFVLDSSGTAVLNTSLAIDAMNKVHISYNFYPSEGGIIVKYATNFPSSWSFTTVPSSGYSSSIDTDNLNKPHISFCDYDNNSLKYAAKISGTWMVQTVDSASDSCSGTSLKIDNANMVHIAYFHENNMTLKYAENSSGSWVSVSVDPLTMIAEKPSLALDSTDGIHISYRDAVNYGLKYAHYAKPEICPRDSDSDGYYDIACGGTDCNDNNPDINPGETETCATIFDDNCDGNANETDVPSCTYFYKDMDNDGFGDASQKVCACHQYADYITSDNTDCDDTRDYVNPSAKEDCNTFEDDDCSGSTNDLDANNCSWFYMDADGDGSGTEDMACYCDKSGNFRAYSSGDCDDSNVLVNPEMPENCLTAYDDDCDFLTNEIYAENCTNFYFDYDNDSYYETSASSECWCEAYGQYSGTLPGDCDDYNGSINPGATETCMTTEDDNCNGNSNDVNAIGCSPFFKDHDMDYYGLTGDSQCMCNYEGEYNATVDGDCNDNDDQINPGMTEICSDGIDNNCANGIDEGC